MEATCGTFRTITIVLYLTHTSVVSRNFGVNPTASVLARAEV